MVERGERSLPLGGVGRSRLLVVAQETHGGAALQAPKRWKSTAVVPLDAERGALKEPPRSVHAMEQERPLGTQTLVFACCGVMVTLRPAQIEGKAMHDVLGSLATAA